MQAVGLNDPVLVDQFLGGGLIGQLGGLDQILEHRVVPALDVVDGRIQRDVQHLAVTHQVVERNMHQERGLANASPCHGNTKVAATKATVARFLKNP